MARPSKDRRLTDTLQAASIQGLIRVINEHLLPITKDEAKKKALIANREHLITLFNKLSNVGSTVQPKQKGSRLLPYECHEATGCGYRIRVTAIWANLAEPICPNPACPRFQKPMDFSGAFFRAMKDSAEAQEEAAKDNADRARELKELEDDLWKDYSPEARAENEAWLTGGKKK